MAINWTEADIERVVASVLKNLKTDTAVAPTKNWDATSYAGRQFVGVYSDMNDAIEAATQGYKAIRGMSLDEREKIITVIRDLTRKEAQIMAEIGVAETKMGRVAHKIAKHTLVADKTPGTSDIVSMAKTGDYGLTLTEMAPFGVVGSITPSTNPSETVICNSIGMIAAGNGVVFNPHPGAIAASNYAVDLINRASLMAGGPKVLVASVVKPTLDTANIMYKHPNIKLLVCTGGPGVVKSVLKVFIQDSSFLNYLFSLGCFNPADSNARGHGPRYALIWAQVALSKSFFVGSFPNSWHLRRKRSSAQAFFSSGVTCIPPLFFSGYPVNKKVQPIYPQVRIN